MADVCIIYSSTDRDKAKQLFEILSESWDVWWDDTVTGKFNIEIEKELQKAKCVVPIWSLAARCSDNVINELEISKENDITLVPAKIEDCKAPYGYTVWSKVDMRSWNGEADHQGLKQLQRKLATIVSPRSPPKRTAEIANRRIKLPSLFHSTSSYETRLEPLEAVKVLSVFGIGAVDSTKLRRDPTILVSAYDLVEQHYPSSQKLKELKQLRNALARFRKKGGFVMVDSGNYEATRLENKTWSRDNLKQALTQTPHDWALSFDYPPPSTKPSSRDRKPYTSVSAILRGIRQDQKLTNAPIIPIVHAPQRLKGGYDLERLPTIIREISESLHPPLIAVPERELGPGLIEGARTVRKIREELAKLPFYQPIHLLGTGNPWSIVVYTAAGADSFDGLEWCRYAVDTEKGTLHHTQHFDFLEFQARLADSSVTQAALDDAEIGISGKVSLHNLDYYANFSAKLQLATVEERLEGFVTKLLGAINVELLEEKIPGIFK